MEPERVQALRDTKALYGSSLSVLRSAAEVIAKKLTG